MPRSDHERRHRDRALIASFGLVGRAVVGDISGLDDATLLARHRALPVVRIMPADGERPLGAGPFDPGGRGWLLPYGPLARPLDPGLLPCPGPAAPSLTAPGEVREAFAHLGASLP